MSELLTMLFAKYFLSNYWRIKNVCIYGKIH